MERDEQAGAQIVTITIQLRSPLSSFQSVRVNFAGKAQAEQTFTLIVIPLLPLPLPMTELNRIHRRRRRIRMVTKIAKVER